MNFTESSQNFAEFGAANPDCPPLHFQTRYEGAMVMYAPLEVVANYLNCHEGWFHRCAQPMKVEPFTKQGYVLTVGKFGSFGYEVEPKIAVIFDPPEEHLYRMYNVPIPDEPTQGYAVDYKAGMTLKDMTWDGVVGDDQAKFLDKFGDRPVPERLTEVYWQLNLQVMVQFPKFIYKLPQNLLRSTGDRLLSRVLAQISPRLTSKIQQDFHSSHDLPLPPKGGSYSRAVETDSAPDLDPATKKEDIHMSPIKAI